MHLEIRQERENDIAQVRKLLLAAFPGDDESRLVDALRENCQAVLSLVAVEADEVLGHILFSPVSTSPPGEALGVGLAPVAVRPDRQSQGIGSRLIETGLRLCKEMGFDYCVVLGDPRYYVRFGFEKASPLGVFNEFGVDAEFMIVLFSARRPVGLVQYESEFGLFD